MADDEGPPATATQSGIQPQPGTETAGGSKASKLADLSTVTAVQRTMLLLLFYVRTQCVLLLYYYFVLPLLLKLLLLFLLLPLVLLLLLHAHEPVSVLLVELALIFAGDGGLLAAAALRHAPLRDADVHVQVNEAYSN